MTSKSEKQKDIIISAKRCFKCDGFIFAKNYKGKTPICKECREIIQKDKIKKEQKKKEIKIFDDKRFDDKETFSILGNKKMKNDFKRQYECIKLRIREFDKKYDDAYFLANVLQLADDIALLIHQYENSEKMIKVCSLKFYFVDKFSHSLPSEYAINIIKKFISKDAVLEIGAGLGLWSRLLKCFEIETIATDDYSWYSEETDYHTNIEQINCTQAIKKYNPQCLFISWGYGVLIESMEKFKGEKIIIIGEKGGCTDYLKSIIKNDEHVGVSPRNLIEGIEIKSEKIYPYKLTKIIQIPKWPNNNDDIRCYKKIH